MKKKTNLSLEKTLFSFFTVVFAVLTLISGCDMNLLEKPFTPPVLPPPPVLPLDASYLTILNLPEHVSQNHVSNVSVSNQLGEIGACWSYDDIIIENNEGSSTVKIPLVYSGSGRSLEGLNFKETGAFFIAFDLNIDAATRITISKSDKFTLNFFEGNAILDISNLTPIPVSALTILNLPANTQKNHFSDVFIYNTAGKTAQCYDYKDIVIIKDDNSVSAMIPLSYVNGNEFFKETGTFIVSFHVNIDYVSYFTVKESDKFTLNFFEGNAIIDISNLTPIPVSALTILNLPANTQKNHFSNVFIYNTAGKTAQCYDYKDIVIIKNNNSVSAMIPLSYVNGNEFFKETGTFIVSFHISIDYVSYFTVKESDKTRLYFTEGNAAFDASLIPPPPPPYLTITSLPGNIKLQNISNVFVYNSAGTAIARCADYDQIIITRDASSATAKIPLFYNNSNEHFIDTGNFIVSFFVNINFTTQIILKEEDKFTLFFTEGNALLDASLIPPAPPPPYLTITSLPKNVKPQNLSNVFVYNSAGTAIAGCADYNQITITTDSDYAAARIPLVYSSSGKPFMDTGTFTVSFSLDIASYIQITKTRDDYLSAAFTDGSGTVDFLKNALAGIELGYFSGGLNNPSDTAAPVIKSGTRFEMNGYYYNVNSNTAVTATSFTNTCIVYVYARLVFNQIEFVYSNTAPAYDSYKKGYYNGLSRALFKFIFIRDSTNKYFAKTFISDNWNHLSCQTVDAYNLASQNLFQHYYLSGTGNPNTHTVTLPAGAYVFTLNGAAGGSIGDSISSGGVNGGSGGHISEVVVLSQNTSFTFFSGEKGGPGPVFNFSMGGTSGGAGGGSGSFAFSPDGYFLCAGGGGGARKEGGSASSSIPSGDGGAGGSIGGGGAGGGYIHTSYGVDVLSGDGGGVNGGRGFKAGDADGASSANDSRINAYSDLTVYSYSLGFNGTGGYAGGAAAYFNLPPPYNWLNTNNANGKGGDSSAAAQSGGNNRNSIRGGGGTPSFGYSTQGNGSVTVHKIN